MIRDRNTMQIISILMYCEVCKHDTKHVLTASGKELVCACGTSQEYHVNKPAKVERRILK